VEGSCELDNEPSGFRKMLTNTLIAAQLTACQERLSSMELVIGKICSTRGRD
jgi:hypothetical protein